MGRRLWSEGRSLHWGASELRPRAQAAGWQQVRGPVVGGESRGQGIPFWAEGSGKAPRGRVPAAWVWKGGPGAGGQRALGDRGE